VCLALEPGATIMKLGGRPGIKSRLYVAAGCIAVAVAVAGIPLPLLPTTPFLLLAAFCFARGSRRWHDWLVGHRVFGPYIAAFREKRGLTLEQKLKIALTVTVTLGVTTYMLRPYLLAQVAVGLAWIAGMIALYLYRSYRP
jgi:uncharacterized membrane protein YbaN (DUF454 family)